MTREKDLGLETQLGKRKQTHESMMLTTSKKLDVAMPNTGG